MNMNRRQMLRTASAGLAVVAGSRFARAQQAQPRGVKALVFDTFGTVVDWRASIIAEGATWGKAKGLTVDWASFADRWRAGYAPAMDKVRKGEAPWTKLDALHRMLLEDLLREFKITGLTEEEKDHWNRVWHRLKPWPDSVTGLARLQRIAAGRHGEECRPALGPDPFG
jgi:2-haloacid dehalogenase